MLCIPTKTPRQIISLNQTRFSYTLRPLKSVVRTPFHTYQSMPPFGANMVSWEHIGHKHPPTHPKDTDQVKSSNTDQHACRDWNIRSQAISNTISEVRHCACSHIHPLQCFGRQPGCIIQCIFAHSHNHMDLGTVFDILTCMRPTQLFATTTLRIIAW